MIWIRQEISYLQGLGSSYEKEKGWCSKMIPTDYRAHHSKRALSRMYNLHLFEVQSLIFTSLDVINVTPIFL